MPDAFDNPGLTLGLALAAGAIAQALARHLRVPGIVLLLFTGVLAGPDVLNVVQPHSLGTALDVLVGFAVAVILFEGGMSLDLGRLRRAHGPIRRLVTVGPIITVAGGAIAGHLLMGWDWTTAGLFGTLVIVTGPTVITPLLRRLKVERSVATVLEAEGVLIDAVGAITAAVALEVATSDAPASLGGLVQIGGRLGFGVAVGTVGGALLAVLLKRRNVIPEGLENIFTLAVVVALFQGSNAMMHESGIAAVTVAGLVVGNVHIHAERELTHFKEQLTVLFIGVLFVLLAADVRVREVTELGWPGLLTVLALMFIVRPLNVLASTAGSKLSTRQRLFIGWIGPRGMVAAAVASLFATKLGESGGGAGNELRAMVFLVITVTVVVAGSTGGKVAQWLKLKRRSDAGWLILGAHPLARELTRLFDAAGVEAMCIDQNHEMVEAAQREGVRVLYGNGLQERTLQRAEVDTRAGAIGMTENEGVNMLFAQRVKNSGKLERLFVSLNDSTVGVTANDVHGFGGEVLFGRPRDVALWSVRLRIGDAQLQRWRSVDDSHETHDPRQSRADNLVLPLLRHRDGVARPIGDQTKFQAGDEVDFVINFESLEEAQVRLTKSGWSLVSVERARTTADDTILD